MPRPRLPYGLLLVAVLGLGAGATVIKGTGRPSAARGVAHYLPPVLRAGVYLAGSGRTDPTDAIVAVRTTRPLVALTFDDGPDPRFTVPVLAALRRAHARVTFFAVGRQVARYPALLRLEARLGHEVGNHTYSHPLLTRLRPGAVRREIALGRRALISGGVRSPRVFRPPHGAFDRVATAAAAHLGEVTIGWDIALDRELDGRSVRAAVSNVMALVHPGSIILAHDGGGRTRERTAGAVSLLLQALHRKGLRSVTIDQLLAARQTTRKTTPRRSRTFPPR